MKILKANGIGLKTIEVSLLTETQACLLKILAPTMNLSTNDLTKIQDSLLRTTRITAQSMKLYKNGKVLLKEPGSRGHVLRKVTEDWHHKLPAILRRQKYPTLEVKRGTLKVKGNKELEALEIQRINEIS